MATRTDDAGQSFAVHNAGMPDPAWDIVFRHAMDVDDEGEFLVVGSTTGSLFCSADGGHAWDCVSPHLPHVYAVQVG